MNPKDHPKVKALLDAIEGMDEVGERIVCAVCGRIKDPLGRSVPMECAGYGCNDSCEGYREDPKPSVLWPGERRSEFGYGWIDMRKARHVFAARDALMEDEDDDLPASAEQAAQDFREGNGEVR